MDVLTQTVREHTGMGKPFEPIEKLAVHTVLWTIRR